ncbi:HAD family hydrolase [Haloimpatiens massiliensis]|uniref:HAD family hydrolase n=1 Tax=Haloimpatiens massiliensis TaxID=1658110 RepID=UPI000C82E523|nr:HAD family hydrolase [Haloimpatiens massiliensis]
MIKLDIPGYKKLEIKNIVFDFNGTIAEDGVLVEGIKERICKLKDLGLDIYVLTADTNGSVAQQCRNLPVNIEIFAKGDALEEKRNIVERLGKDNTIAVGNGRNDADMFKSSILSIAIIGSEGCYSKTLLEADIVVNSPLDAAELLLKPNRVKATLRI